MDVRLYELRLYRCSHVVNKSKIVNDATGEAW